METIPVKNATIVHSRGQDGFNQVVDSFKTAKWINIISYNIFFNSTNLDALHKAPDSCRIRIVTNIPKQSSEEAQEKQYSLYMRFLKPETFNMNTSVFFNFENHSKIIMTDTIAYVGSANFSCSNYHEFGLILQDTDAINQLDRVISNLCKDSAGYYSNRLCADMKRLTDFPDIDYNILNKLIFLCTQANESRKHRNFSSNEIPGLINIA